MTGDTAVVRPAKYASSRGSRIRIVDRSKDMLLVGGENVYSTEVESVLFSHPLVAQACVFGVPNDVMGEVVAAAVVLHGAADATGAATVRTLQDFCREKLSSYKVPTSISFLPEMPLTGSGKIVKKEVKYRILISGSTAAEGVQSEDVFDLSLLIACLLYTSDAADE